MHKHTAPIRPIGFRRNGRPIYPIAGAAGTVSGNPVLDRLREQRESAVSAMDTLLSQAEQREGGGLSDAERSTLDTTREQIADLDAQIEPLAEFANLRSASSDAVRQYTSTFGSGGQPAPEGARSAAARTEPRAHEYGTRGEVVADMLRAAPPGRGGMDDQGARERLMGARIPFDGAPEDYTRAVSNEITSDVPGLLPKPIVGAVDNDLDAARPFVQSIGAKDLGSIPGKTFTRPYVSQHTLVGKQTTEKSELPSQKLKVDGLDFTKETYGGTIDVSRQTIDWTSPAAWDALLNDLQDEYAITTEEVAAAAFATAVTQTAGAPATNDMAGWSLALYNAAALAYAGVKRLPDHIWVSLDMWGAMGSIVDQARMSMRANGDSMGTSSPASFAGEVLDLPRSVVPGFPDGTIIVGVKSKTEFYEQRIGLLTAVEPRLLGVEVAYGGYVAYGTLKPTAFAKVGAFVPPAG